MFRQLTLAAAIMALFMSPRAHAQDDDAWKTLVMRALYEAGSKDLGKAEQTFQQALKEAERFGADDPRVGTTLNSLGLVYRAEKKYAEAENSYRRALVILQKAYGIDSIDVANVNFNIASVMFDQGHQAGTLPLLQRTLVSYENTLGGNSLKTAAVLCMLGDVHRLAKDFPAAEGPLKRCADIRETNGGIQSPEMADALHSLALTYIGEGKYAVAEPRLTLAEKIRESTLGITSPVLAQTLEDHSNLLRLLGKGKEADRLASMAAAIRRNAQPGPPTNAPQTKK